MPNDVDEVVAGIDVERVAAGEALAYRAGSSTSR